MLSEYELGYSAAEQDYQAHFKAMERNIQQLERNNKELLESLAQLYTLNPNPSLVVDDPSGMIKIQAAQIEELKDALKAVLDAYNGCQCGCDPDDEWHKARILLVKSEGK